MTTTPPRFNRHPSPSKASASRDLQIDKGLTMLDWKLMIALTMVAVVLAAITELAESLIKGDKK